jgi:hypothetical protein
MKDQQKNIGYMPRFLSTWMNNKVQKVQKYPFGAFEPVNKE